MEERKQKILAAVVDEYIKTGEPVGSKAIASLLDISVSSATIRNDMAALEQQGYLEQPHTSAGRVPTFKSYRLYIDELMQPQPLSDQEQGIIDELLGASEPTEEILLQSASRALSEVTKCASVVASASPQFSVITKVEVIPTGRRMYVLLLITSSGSIKNRVCRLSFDLTDDQMQFFTGFVNQNLQGVKLENLSPARMQSLATALGSYMLALSPLLYAVYELSSELMVNNVELKGEANLLSCREFSPEEIIRFLENKSELRQLLTDSFSGLQVMFGREQSNFVITNSSMILSPYSKGADAAGALGIIGPMRIDYAKVIPYIEYLTEKVSNILSEEEGNFKPSNDKVIFDGEGSIVKNEGN